MTEERQASDIWFRMMVESAVEYAIFSMDDDGTIATWNSGAERLLGFGRDEAVGQEASVIFTAEDREAGVPLREMETARAEGTAADERWHVRKDGSRFWGSGRMMRIDAEGASGHGFVKVVRDLTADKRAEGALRESEERFARTFVANPAAMALAAAATSRFTAANEAFYALTGYFRAEMVGRTPQELRLWTPPEGGSLTLDQLADDAETRGQLVALRHKSGETRKALALAGRTSLPPDGDLILLVLVDVEHIWPANRAGAGEG